MFSNSAANSATDVGVWQKMRMQMLNGVVVQAGGAQVAGLQEVPDGGGFAPLKARRNARPKHRR